MKSFKVLEVMMINDNHNLECSFADDLVAYLYGEIGANEKADFEAHLSRCQPCAVELSAFGAVRSSVIEWRERDLAPLQTPPIILPFPEKPAAAAALGTVSESRTWLTALRELFSLSPAWAGAATACAALVICAGLFYVAVSSLRSTGETDLSEANTKVKSSVVNRTVPSPTVEAAVQSPNADNDKTQTSDKSPKPEVVANSKPAASGKTKTGITDKKAEIYKTKSQPKSAGKNSANSPQMPKRNDVRLLEEDEDEDESLRLADLFDEIGER